MGNITITGVDLSKDVFEVRSENHVGRKVVGRTMNRARFRQYLEELPKGSIVAMEACGSSHYWARESERLGLFPKLISPQFVKPYRKSQKNDRNDAEAICEAARRPTMRFVSVKTVEQLTIQQVHRVRERSMKEQTALMNQIRGFLGERGVVIPRGVKALKEAVKRELELSKEECLFHLLLSQLWEEFNQVHERVRVITKEIEMIARTNEQCRQIQELRGVGPIIATAVVASIGDPRVFKNGRGFSASLGIVPKQFSTGGKTTLGRITKRGDNYLRKLLVHGARAAVIALLQEKDSRANKLSLWVQQLHGRCGFNRTVVALANKLARQIWAILAGKMPREEQELAMAA